MTCAPRAVRLRGENVVPNPGAPSSASAQGLGRSGGRDDGRDARPRRHVRGRELRRHTATADARAARAGRLEQVGVEGGRPLRSASPSRRVAGRRSSSPSVSVSSTRCDAPTRLATSAARRSLSPKRISSSATASFSFTIGDHVQGDERLERPARVQILAAMREVERRQQHLTDGGARPRRRRRATRASRAAGRPQRPPGVCRVARTWATSSDLGPARGDRARGDDDDGPALLAQGHDVAGDVDEHVEGDAATVVGHRGGADLDDDATTRHRAPPRRGARDGRVVHVASHDGVRRGQSGARRRHATTQRRAPPTCIDVAVADARAREQPVDAQFMQVGARSRRAPGRR